jgi:predicted glycosyltransferase
MRIFIDIGHPAHVHYFKNFIHLMKDEGHEIFVSARDRYPVKELLEAYNIKFYNRGKGRNSMLGKLMYMLYADFMLFTKALKFKPDLFISFGAVYLTHVSKMMNKPSIFIDDTDNARLNRKFYIPFATHILTPNVYEFDLGKKQIRFNGYMELAYLHPRFFKKQNNAYTILGLQENTPYVVLRFVNWNASHDFGHSGITIEDKMKAVTEFAKYAKVFITSEKELPKELEEYRINISPEQMHEVIASAEMLYGESATMASEAAVLGVPAVYIDNDGRCYTDEEERKYGIVYNFTESISDVEKSIIKGLQILKSKSKLDYKEKRRSILREKISFTDYLCWLVTNYPKSIEQLKKDIKFQDKFIFNE